MNVLDSRALTNVMQSVDGTDQNNHINTPNILQFQVICRYSDVFCFNIVVMVIHIKSLLMKVDRDSMHNLKIACYVV